MTSEVRNALAVVGTDAPLNAPSVRNALAVVGHESPANAPSVRNVVVVVGFDDPTFAGGGSSRGTLGLTGLGLGLSSR